MYVSVCDWVAWDCAGAWCSHACSYVGFLTPSLVADGKVSQRSAQQAHWHKPFATWTHGHSKCTYTDMQTGMYSVWHLHLASSIMWELTFYKKQKCCKMMFNSITFAYSEPFSRTVSCWVRQHTLAGVPAAGVLANCEGRTTGTSTWLGANTWGPVMVNKISE